MEQQKKEKILKTVRDILEEYPKGIRYADLVKLISSKLPEIKINTIHGNMSIIRQDIDSGKIIDIARPDKGLYILQKYLKNELTEVQEGEDQEKTTKLNEQEFYKLFADYLVNELEECTSAIPLGGKTFQDKWGTPDVIGTYKIVGFTSLQTPVEFISAEIKINSNASQLIIAFGQACSYKLFSHKVYLVIPNDVDSIESKRIESLCLKLGIGLILFDKNNKNNPNFEIKTRAIKSEPDYFYLQKYLISLGVDKLKNLF